MPLKFANNQSLTSTTALPSAVPTDNLILISTQTASNSANISFTTGLNGTYDVYEFKFINIYPRIDDAGFYFNASTDGGSNYNVTKTTTAVECYHSENDAAAALSYNTGGDLAQSTSAHLLGNGIGADSDQSLIGTLTLFNPSSTTYVKHFIADTNNAFRSDYTMRTLTAGYLNTTSAVNAIRFTIDTGNFDGTIKLYGVKKS